MHHPRISCSVCVAESPRITIHPQELKYVVQGKPAKFTIQATGTEPLSYQWEWKPAEEEGGSEEWQPCPAEWSDGATLTVLRQMSIEGNYRCVISNCAGSVTAELEVCCSSGEQVDR